MAFWQNVENELNYKNMSRRELAEKAAFAVSGISLGLSNKSVPSADLAVRIAEVLGVSTEYLVQTRNSLGKAINNSSYFNEYQDIYAYALIMILLVLLVSELPLWLEKLFSRPGGRAEYKKRGETV